MCHLCHHPSSSRRVGSPGWWHLGPAAAPGDTESLGAVPVPARSQLDTAVLQSSLSCVGQFCRAEGSSSPWGLFTLSWGFVCLCWPPGAGSGPCCRVCPIPPGSQGCSLFRLLPCATGLPSVPCSAHHLPPLLQPQRLREGLVCVPELFIGLLGFSATACVPVGVVS